MKIIAKMLSLILLSGLASCKFMLPSDAFIFQEERRLQAVEMSSLDEEMKETLRQRRVEIGFTEYQVTLAWGQAQWIQEDYTPNGKWRFLYFPMGESVALLNDTVVNIQSATSPIVFTE
jgi:hypothetical protein